MDGERRRGRRHFGRASRIRRSRAAERGGVRPVAATAEPTLSDIRFLREGLGISAGPRRLLHDRRPRIRHRGGTDDCAPESPANYSDRCGIARRPRRGQSHLQARPHTEVVALGLSETETDVIAWAEAGVCGYVPRSAALRDLVEILAQIVRGEQPCSSRIAASLLRRIAKGPASGGDRPGSAPPEADEPPALTRREEHVVRLLGAGLSNKEIARDLKIGVATIKSHVHSVLRKLALERRGQVARWLHDHENRQLEPRDASRQPAERGLAASQRGQISL